jgi:hypothetical protein
MPVGACLNRSSFHRDLRNDWSWGQRSRPSHVLIPTPWQSNRNRFIWTTACAAALTMLACTISGCGLMSSPPPPNPSPEAAADVAEPPGPEAKIAISYAKHGDYLSSMVVTKYSAANTITTIPKGGRGVASTVLFEGGVVVWQADINKSDLSGFPGFGQRIPYAVTHVKYGEIPRGFTQTSPDSGPPEPLEPDHYYVFAVIRASGSTNYEAVKVQSDGGLIAYNAEPRAGDSFQLCCNIAPDFTVTAAGTADMESPSAPDSMATPENGGGDSDMDSAAPDGGSSGSAVP